MHTEINKNKQKIFCGKFSAPLLVLPLIFLLHSCEFNPTGTNFIDIPQEQPVANINLNFSIDTIKVWGETNFNYSIDIGERKIDSVNLYVDNKLFASKSSSVGNIFFNSNEYSNNSHKLKIEIIASSGTGSISDVLGAEKAIFTKEWTLIIDNQTPGSLKITSAGPSNGRLKIQWQKYYKFNFQFYSLYKNDVLVTILKNQNINTWTDSDYVCGKAEYRVDITAANQVGVGNVLNYDGNYSRIINLTVTDSNKVKLVWSKNIFYNNFGSYAVYRGYYTPGKQIIVLKNINDTTYIDEYPVFGKETIYSVGAYPPGYAGYSGNESTGSTCSIGNKMLEAYTIQYIPSLNSVYILNSNGIYRLDAGSFSILSSQNSRFNDYGEAVSVSQNGQYMYVSGNASFVKLDPLTLTVEKTIPTNSIVKYTSYINSGFKVTDLNLIAYSSTVPLQYQGGFKLVSNLILNMNSNSIADSTTYEESSLVCFISNNSKYFYANSTLYRIYNNHLSGIGNISGYQFGFIDDGERYVTLTNNSLQINRSSDMSTIVSISIEQPQVYCYDPVTDYIGVSENINDENYFVIYDTQNGNEIQKAQVYGSTWYYFANSTLFSYDGFYLHLNLK